MGHYVLQRLVSGGIVLVGIATLVFLLARFVPGDTVQMMLGLDATPERVARLRTLFGLDRPLHVQYATWLVRVIHGDLGRSLVTERAVVSDLRERMGATLVLTLASMLVALAVAAPLGVLAGLYRRGPLDILSGLVGVAGLSVPHFWLGTILVLLLAVKYPLLPAGGYVGILENPAAFAKHLVLPAIALGITNAAPVMRMLRTSLIEVLTADYIRTARAKGLPGRTVLWRHAIKNAMMPVLTVLGIQLGRMLSGVIVVEQVFSWPGLGSLSLYAISQRDYPVLQGVTLVVASFYVATNMLIDLSYALLDPRIHYV